MTNTKIVEGFLLNENFSYMLEYNYYVDLANVVHT